MKITTISLLIIVFLAFPAFAEREVLPPLALPTAASSGFGGTHIAYTDNVYALMVNPAAMMQVQQRNFFTLAPTLFNPESTFSLIDPIMNLVEGDLSSLGDISDSLKGGNIALGTDITGPISFAWVANGFGFGVFNRIFVNANIRGGTNLQAHVYVDFVLPVGLAYGLLDRDGHTVDAGITLKPFARARAWEMESIFWIIESDENQTEFTENIDVPLIMGFGFDIGFLYRSDFGLSAGLTFNDILTRGGAVTSFHGNTEPEDFPTYEIPFTMNLGLAYEYKFDNVSWNPRVVFAFDWRNITNVFQQSDYLNSRNASLDLGLGIQFSVFDRYSIRIGMSEMLPAFGLGVQLGSWSIDLAYYGKEFGNEPGQLSAAMLGFNVTFRPEAQHREWPWTKSALFGPE